MSLAGSQQYNSHEVSSETELTWRPSEDESFDASCYWSPSPSHNAARPSRWWIVCLQQTNISSNSPQPFSWTSRHYPDSVMDGVMSGSMMAAAAALASTSHFKSSLTLKVDWCFFIRLLQFLRAEASSHLHKNVTTTVRGSVGMFHIKSAVGISEFPVCLFSWKTHWSLILDSESQQSPTSYFKMTTWQINSWERCRVYCVSAHLSYLCPMKSVFKVFCQVVSGLLLVLCTKLTSL